MIDESIGILWIILLQQVLPRWKAIAFGMTPANDDIVQLAKASNILTDVFHDWSVAQCFWYNLICAVRFL